MLHEGLLLQCCIYACPHHATCIARRQLQPQVTALQYNVTCANSFCCWSGDLQFKLEEREVTCCMFVIMQADSGIRSRASSQTGANQKFDFGEFIKGDLPKKLGIMLVSKINSCMHEHSHGPGVQM